MYIQLLEMSQYGPDRNHSYIKMSGTFVYPANTLYLLYKGYIPIYLGTTDSYIWYLVDILIYNQLLGQ
jgi:hypothetical protein